MRFYISDLHFGHENVMKFDKRPFETLAQMHEEMIRRWNSRVDDDDIVYVLGDITWNNETGIEVFSQLKGRKFLILGNHDKPNKALNSLFEWTKEYADVVDGKCHVVLSHYPMICWKRSDYGSVHLYGHVHNGRDFEFVLKNHREMKAAGIRHECYNVGCMMPYMDYTPRTLAEIREGAAKFGLI